MLTATRTFLLFFFAQATCSKGHTAANKLGDENLAPKIWSGEFPYQVKVKLVLPKVTEVPKKILADLGVNPAVGRFDNCVDEDLAEDLIQGMLALGK
jgi:hypothetical protein